MIKAPIYNQWELDRLSKTTPPEEETQATRDRLIRQGPPLGTHRVHLGPLGYITQGHWDRKPDWAYIDCVLVLVNYLGSGMWVRYPKTDIVA